MQVFQWKKSGGSNPQVKKSWIIGIISGIFGIIILSTMFYQVDTDSVGVITRFGKYIDTTQPGLHVKVPLGIDKVVRVPVQRVQKEEFGFRTVKAGIQTEYIKGRDEDVSLMVFIL